MRQVQGLEFMIVSLEELWSKRHLLLASLVEMQMVVLETMLESTKAPFDWALVDWALVLMMLSG